MSAAPERGGGGGGEGGGGGQGERRYRGVKEGRMSVEKVIAWKCME
jgi:hypothetical protein